MKKYLALVLAVLMVVALCAGCGDKAETEPAAETTAETTAAAPAADEAVPAAADAAGDWNAYLEYVCAYAAAGAPTEDEATAVTDSIKACADVDALNAIPQMTVIFENTGVMTYDAWVAAGCPAADTTNVTGEAAASGDKASGAPSGDKASGAPSGDKASGAPSGEGGGATLVEPDYTKYSKDFKGYQQYCIDAFSTDEHAPEDMKESTNTALAAAVDENDESIAMLVDVGLIVDYATFIAG